MQQESEVEQLTAEVCRLLAEGKDIRAELGTIKAENQDLQTELGKFRASLVAQAPPPQTMAQYPPAQEGSVPQGQQYGSPIPSSTMAQGHYSPTVVPYQGAANLTASPGQVGFPPGFTHGTPAQSLQVHGSPQPQGPQVFLRPPTFVPPGPNQALIQQVQSPPNDPMVSLAGSTG